MRRSFVISVVKRQRIGLPASAAERTCPPVPNFAPNAVSDGNQQDFGANDLGGGLSERSLLV